MGGEGEGREGEGREGGDGTGGTGGLISSIWEEVNEKKEEEGENW